MVVVARIIPLLVLVGLIAAATLRNRGGGDVEALERPFDVDTTHDTAAEAEALRLEGSDDHPLRTARRPF